MTKLIKVVWSHFEHTYVTSGWQRRHDQHQGRQPDGCQPDGCFDPRWLQACYLDILIAFEGKFWLKLPKVT